MISVGRGIVGGMVRSQCHPVSMYNVAQTGDETQTFDHVISDVNVINLYVEVTERHQ